MSMSANEEPHNRHCGFYTLGLFTSKQRALACIRTRGMSAGALSILPVSLNAPLSPCLSTGLLTAHETRQMVCPAVTPSPSKALMHAYRSSQGWRMTRRRCFPHNELSHR